MNVTVSKSTELLLNYCGVLTLSICKTTVLLNKFIAWWCDFDSLSGSLHFLRARRANFDKDADFRDEMQFLNQHPLAVWLLLHLISCLIDVSVDRPQAPTPRMMILKLMTFTGTAKCLHASFK